MHDDEIVPCCICPHDVDNHDEHARCMTVSCSCGWIPRLTEIPIRLLGAKYPTAASAGRQTPAGHQQRNGARW